ncbi:pyridoxal phosphate-dependent aminotransferase [Sphingobacterium bambusae]|uniref:Pyridoxal phosphate-dependent aminotransferase n=1 Tax=Sphingobacterium bambusae TaxID=662858 RepID=A0ABW6BAJ6_9SPHI|nr:histidinol-phosphate transaminase [Sphingobacterium bambusae]WPL48741.1 histidinol-phosphate transaminase [Sphingobacterium bambusae]
MHTNRRDLLKKLGLGVIGLSLPALKLKALPSFSETLISPQDQRLPVVLRSNENPYGPSPAARKAIADNLAASNRYHWDVTAQLLADLAEKHQVQPDNILLGAGCTEILDLVAKHVALQQGSYVIADPSYDYWTTTLDHLGSTKIKVPLNNDRKIDLAAMRKAIRPDTKLVYICNPNNPTSTCCDHEELLHFVEEVSKETLVLIDEAYLEFTKEKSLVELVGKTANIIVAKTFSKIYGLAGARVGYALAEKGMIEQLSKLQSLPNNNVSILSKLAAMASLKDDGFVAECYQLNERVRQYSMLELKKLGCRCIPSQTNFIYFSLANFKKDYFRTLQENNIQGTRIYEEQGAWTRITVGTQTEMQRFIAALQ